MDTTSTATGRDADYVLSLDDVAARYAAAGHPRTLRTLQRYCASGVNRPAPDTLIGAEK